MSGPGTQDWLRGCKCLSLFAHAGSSMRYASWSRGRGQALAGLVRGPGPRPCRSLLVPGHVQVPELDQTDRFFTSIDDP